MRNNWCIDCEKQLNNFYAKRCKSCARVYQYATKPETNPQYIDGRTNVKKVCIDCGKELSRSANIAEYERCLSCSRKGELHWNWLGGDELGYTVEFSKQLKEKIRIRDNHECQVCHKSEEQELKEFNRVLSVHHVDYNKENCQSENLISLCDKCHMKTNYNRENWINYFGRIINLCQKI